MSWRVLKRNNLSFRETLSNLVDIHLNDVDSAVARLKLAACLKQIKIHWLQQTWADFSRREISFLRFQNIVDWFGLKQFLNRWLGLKKLNRRKYISRVLKMFLRSFLIQTRNYASPNRIKPFQVPKVWPEPVKNVLNLRERGWVKRFLWFSASAMKIIFQLLTSQQSLRSTYECWWNGKENCW